MEKMEKDLTRSFNPYQYKSLRCSCSFSMWFFFSVQGGLAYLPSILLLLGLISDYTKHVTYVAGVFHWHAESLGQLINPSVLYARRTSRRDASPRLAWRIMQVVEGQSLISSSFVLSRVGIGSCFLGALAHVLHALDWEEWPGSGGEYASSRLASLKATFLRQPSLRESQLSGNQAWLWYHLSAFSPITVWWLPPGATMNLGSWR